jgi:hypothetical protein
MEEKRKGKEAYKIQRMWGYVGVKTAWEAEAKLE